MTSIMLLQTVLLALRLLTVACTESHLPAPLWANPHYGSLSCALVFAEQCNTPTSWAEQDDGTWFAVCGDANGNPCDPDLGCTDDTTNACSQY